MKKKVLVIDDDLNVCRDIKYALQNDNTTDVYYALSVAEALEVFMKQHFCLVIMDVLLAEADGRELLRIMRQAKTIPILVLSSKASSAERTSLLQTGANVYLEKPYDLDECLAQAESLMQLYTDAKPVESRCYTLAFGMDLIIDPTYWKVTLMGEPLELTHKEFGLLYCLASHKGQVLTREQLYSQVWNNDSEINLEATIKSHIRSLRQKMSPKGKNYIESVRGVGYRFNAEQASDGDESEKNKK